jgi:hypothetical protein
MTNQQPNWVGALQLSSKLKIGRNKMLRELRRVGAYYTTYISGKYATATMMRMAIGDKNGFKTYTPLFNIDRLDVWEKILRDVPRDKKKENFGRVHLTEDDLDMMEIIG